MPPTGLDHPSGALRAAAGAAVLLAISATAAAGPPNPCSWDNGPPADCFGSPASQFSPAYPFAAEAANDLILIDLDGPENPCVLTSVAAWITFFNGADAPEAITGYVVSVYADLGDPKQPAGNLQDDGTYAGEVIDAQFVPAAGITPIPITLPLTGTIYEVTIPVLLEVPKNQKLWLSVAPQLEFPPQTALVLTQAGPFDHAAQQIFNLLALPWTEIAGGDCDGDGTVDDLDGDGIADFREIAMSIVGEKGVVQPVFCPWDCGNPDKAVDIQDLLALLAQWTGPGPCDFDGTGIVDIVDLLDLLAHWGACPAPANDECLDQQTIVVTDAGHLQSVDMRGSTPSPEPPACVTGAHKDVWYCLTLDVLEPTTLTITTSFDVFLELYEDCGCPPGPLKTCAPGLQQFGGIQNVLVMPGQQCCLRLVNDLDLPNEQLIGSLNLQVVPFPSNDTCADATEATVTLVNDPPTPAFGNTAGDGDGLAAALGCGSPPDAQMVGTNWYWVEGDGTTFTATLCNPGTDPAGGSFDTRLSVLCLGCVTPLCVDWNDDDGDPACGPTSTVSWCTAPGEVYRIVVHGGPDPADNEGLYELTVVSDGVTCPNPPTCGPLNDGCLAHVEILQGLTPFDTTLATSDGPDNPAGLCSDSGYVPTGHDLWYHHQVPSDGILLVDTCEDFGGSADFDTDLVVYGPYAQLDDISCDHADLLATIAGCNDDALNFDCGNSSPWHSVVQIPVSAGEHYLIRVGGRSHGDLGTGVVEVDILPAPVGACCVDEVCVGTLEENQCLAQTGCLLEWREGEDCAAGFDCAIPTMPCDPLTIGGIPAADGENGVRPGGVVGGWNFGAMGVMEDLVVCDPVTAMSVHAEFIDLTSPVGTPSALTQMRVRIFDAAGGFYDIDPVTAVPLLDVILTVGTDATKAICGGPSFGGDVECWDGTISAALSPGYYGVHFSFPELGDDQYFIATGGGPSGELFIYGTPNATSPEQSQIWGIRPDLIPVFGDDTGQHNSFCVGE